MRLLACLLLSLAATAACPSADGYANTCWVSTLGSNSNAGTISSPFLTLQKAADTAAAGDKIRVRGGRYTSTTTFVGPTTSGTALAPIKFMPHNGELVIIDGSQNVTKRFMLTTPANTHGSHYRFHGFKFENWPYDSNIMLSQGEHPGIQFNGLRFEIEGSSIILNPLNVGTDYKFLGTHFRMGFGVQCIAYDGGDDEFFSITCPHSNPTYIYLSTKTSNWLGNHQVDPNPDYPPTLSINGGPAYEVRNSAGGIPGESLVVGNGHGFRLVWTGTYWRQMLAGGFDCSAMSGTVSGQFHGCDGLKVMDSSWYRYGAASDNIGGEGGTGGDGALGTILFKRVDVYSTYAANDCFDMKATGITLRWLRVFGCSAKGPSVWGYSNWEHVMSDGPSFIGGDYNSRDVTNAYNENGTIRVVPTYGEHGGLAPVYGHRIQFAGIQGCTTANGTFRVKDSVSRDALRIMTDAGENVLCDGAYISSPASTTRLAPPHGGGLAGAARWLTIKRSGGGMGFFAGSYTGMEWSFWDSIIANDNTSTGYGVSSNNTTIPSRGRNLHYSGRGQTYATSYSYDPGVQMGDGGLLLTTWEPTSAYGNPNLHAPDANAWTKPAFRNSYRATATTPTSAWNKGYWAGTNTVKAGEDAQAIRFRAIEAEDTCSVTLDDNSDFSSPIATATSDPGPIWREVIFRSLAPGATYHHKVACGYDVVTGQAATTAAVSGTATVELALRASPDADQVQAAYDYHDGTGWTSGSPVDCSAGCTITSPSLERGRIYSFRHRRISAGGTTLATSEARASLIP